MELPDHLTRTFSALADPTRRAILARLASGEASVTELAEPFDDEPSRHLQTPEGAGARRPDHPRPRGAVAAMPAARRDPLKGAADWLEHYRMFWEQSLDRLEDYLKELQSKEKRRGRKH